MSGLAPGILRLTTIGTGPPPVGDARAAGHLVEAASVRLLLDCGSGVVHRMAALGVDWPAITHVALTHSSRPRERPRQPVRRVALGGSCRRARRPSR
jgi:hypothetical protein